MRAVLYAHNVTNRSVWVADSFEGLPVANEQQYPEDVGSDFHTYEQLAVSLEQVQENFRTYDLLDGQTKFLKGWFKDTLPTVPVDQFALIRLDGDMYESTMDALNNLYPKLSPQGYVIIDDYGVVPACKAAVHDYCNSIGIQPEIIEIDGVGVYWKKSCPINNQLESVDLDQDAISPEMQINRLNEALIELSQRVMAYSNQSMTNRDDAINKLSRKLTKQDNDMVSLNQTLLEREKELALVYSSVSWKITKPIRSATNIVNRILRKQV